METLKRKPFQGVLNIVRFNWHFYAIAVIFVTLLLLLKTIAPLPFLLPINLLSMLIITGSLVSLTVSCYVYDFSGLYSLNWMDQLHIGEDKTLVNIHAGFDETSALIQSNYPRNKLLVFDFYDPLRHTEVSIKRARKAYPEFPGTKHLVTSSAQIQADSVDFLFLILSAHEIRLTEERMLFFKQLCEALKAGGKIILVEHQRDLYNFLAYNFGFFHFLSGKTWEQTYKSAGLICTGRSKLNPFITLYTLSKNGNPS